MTTGKSGVVIDSRAWEPSGRTDIDALPL